ASCAEALADDPQGRARARERRQEIERRLGDNAASALPMAPPAPVIPKQNDVTSPIPSEVIAQPRADARAPSPLWVRPVWISLSVAACASAVGTAVLYALARRRASDFRQEQDRAGYSEAARD